MIAVTIPMMEDQLPDTGYEDFEASTTCVCKASIKPSVGVMGGMIIAKS